MDIRPSTNLGDLLDSVSSDAGIGARITPPSRQIDRVGKTRSRPACGLPPTLPDALPKRPQATSPPHDRHRRGVRRLAAIQRVLDCVPRAVRHPHGRRRRVVSRLAAIQQVVARPSPQPAGQPHAAAACERRSAAIRQGPPFPPFPPPCPAVRPCRVHGRKSRPCGKRPRRRDVGTGRLGRCQQLGRYPAVDPQREASTPCMQPANRHLYCSRLVLVTHLQEQPPCREHPEPRP